MKLRVFAGMLLAAGLLTMVLACGSVMQGPLAAEKSAMVCRLPMVGRVAPADSPERVQAEAHNTEGYDRIVENAFLAVKTNPLSTFSVDVDTASYSNVRRMLHEARRPPAGAVRIEELINYFSYDYPEPEGTMPFSAITEVAACPWNAKHRLVHIGLQGKRIAADKLPPRNLVFLLDVSGSMASADKLPLVRSGMWMLASQLTEKDSVAIVVYAGAAGLVLPPTSGDNKTAIREALGALRAGGSTNGGKGIELAYKVARQNFRKGGINRVILATDGDFNVGTSSRSGLIRLIEAERKSGVFLTVLGVGRGNLKDSTMEQLADNGNGNYAYIDSAAEARKVLVTEAGATLVTIAKDVKIQVEFNPNRVAAYRLIGYENRMLRAEDFNDDKMDAGEIGAGHTVTALYEIVPAGVSVPTGKVDGLKYQTPRKTTGKADSRELMTVKLRWKAPDGETSKLLSAPILDAGARFEEASEAFRFSAAVAGFGMLLRGSKYKGNTTYDLVRKIARAARTRDAHGYRAEFVRLVSLAESLMPESKGSPDVAGR